MEPVKLTRTGHHVMITGSDRGAVEQAIEQLCRGGAKAVGKIQPLGNNWIATCDESAKAAVPQHDVRVERFGLQTMITASSKEAVEIKVEQLMTYGAALVTPPTLDGGKWLAVIDERASTVKQPRQ